MKLAPNIKQELACRVVGAARAVRPQKISSQALLGPRGVLFMKRGGREYRLRLTQDGKLILTA